MTNVRTSQGKILLEKVTSSHGACTWILQIAFEYFISGPIFLPL